MEDTEVAEVPQLLLPEGLDSEIYQYEIPEQEASQDDKEDDIKEQLRMEREAKIALEARLASLERQQHSAQQVFAPQPQQQVQQPQIDRAALSKQLTDQFYADPGAALLNLFETAQAAARQEIQKTLIPVQGATVRGAIAQYRATAKMPDEVLEEFDTMIKKIPADQLASVDPGAVPDYLGAIQKMAYGEAAIKGKLTSARHIPVNLGGSSGSRGIAAGKKSLQLTKSQQKNVETMRAAGWAEKDIYQALKDGDLD
jgi:hypothetical protein